MVADSALLIVGAGIFLSITEDPSDESRGPRWFNILSEIVEDDSE